jgi:hypothetical protein
MAAPIFVGVFETIDREMLLWKMEQCGVKDAELEWFRSYLSDRCDSDSLSLIDKK